MKCIYITLAFLPIVMSCIKTKTGITELYTNEFIDSNPYLPSGWTGNIDMCDEGTTSKEFREATLSRINFYRCMGMNAEPLTENTDLHSMAQHTALIMSANGIVNHTNNT